MYETRKHPPLSRRHFLRRMAAHFLAAQALAAVSMLIGMAGYEYFENLAWRDAFLNSAMLLGGIHQQAARHHQRFLVGHQHAFAGLDRSQRRQQPRRPDDGRHHLIRFGVAGDGDQRIDACGNFNLEPGGLDARFQPLRASGVRHHGHARQEFAAQFEQARVIIVGRQRENLQLVLVPPRNIECIAADGAGGAKNDEVLQ